MDNIKKINRKLKCNLTKKIVTVKPDKYEKLLSLYGDEKKIRSRFISAEVEKEARKPNLKFWAPFCLDLKDFKSSVKEIILPFKDSKRIQSDFVNLDDKIKELCRKFLISYKNIEYIEIKDNRGIYISGLKLMIPFFGDYNINAHEK